MDFTPKQILEAIIAIVSAVSAFAVAFALVVYKQRQLSKGQEKISEKQEKMAEKQEKMSSKQEVMAREIEIIWSDIGKKLDKLLQFQNPKSATQGQSPVTLTKVGRKISDDLGAPKILDQLKDQLKDMVFADGRPSNAYDLQEKAFNVAKQKLPNFLTPEQLDAAKSAAYEHNSLLSEIMMVFGVLLRDMLMKEAGFPDPDADQHEASNPNNAA